MLAGDFLDFIFDRPEALHELVTDADLSKILKELKPHLKNMLYYLFLHDYSALEYAESIGQSDRSIRSIRETALKKIRKLYGGVLAYRKENNLPMSIDEKYFLETPQTSRERIRALAPRRFPHVARVKCQHNEPSLCQLVCIGAGALLFHSAIRRSDNQRRIFPFFIQIFCCLQIARNGNPITVPVAHMLP